MHTLATLTRDIESGASIAVHKDGTWHKRWDPKGITSFFRRLFKLEFGDNLALASLVKDFIKSTELSSKSLRIQHVPDSNLDIERAITAVKMRLAPRRAERVKEHKRLIDVLSEKKTLRDLTEDHLKVARQYKDDVDSIPGIEDRLRQLKRVLREPSRRHYCRGHVAVRAGLDHQHEPHVVRVCARRRHAGLHAHQASASHVAHSRVGDRRHLHASGAADCIRGAVLGRSCA